MIRVTQSELASCYALTVDLETAREGFQKALRAYDAAADPVLAKLLEDRPIEPGILDAAIAWTERRSPAWRREFERRLDSLPVRY